jgi:hypothetical protein
MFLELHRYRDTGNGAHAWAAYSLWRELAGSKREPPPMPPDILSYFDEVAAGLLQVRGSEGLGRLLRVSGKSRGRGGGPSGAQRAALQRKADSVKAELFIHFYRATADGPPPRGTMNKIFAEVAREEKMSVGAVKTMVTRGRLMESVKSQARWLRDYVRGMSPAARKRSVDKAKRAVAQTLAEIERLPNSASSPTK